MKGAGKKTNVELSDSEIKLLEDLNEKLGLSKSAIIRRGLFCLAKEECVEWSTSDVQKAERKRGAEKIDVVLDIYSQLLMLNNLLFESQKIVSEFKSFTQQQKNEMNWIFSEQLLIIFEKMKTVAEHFEVAS